jgi:hypothetical protein
MRIKFLLLQYVIVNNRNGSKLIINNRLTIFCFIKK